MVLFSMRAGGELIFSIFPPLMMAQRQPRSSLSSMGGGTGEEAAEMTGFSQLSDQKGFLVVYPDGVDQHWNDGRGTTPPDVQGVDDVGFVSALLQDLSQSLKINRGRVYATGMS